MNKPRMYEPWGYQDENNYQGADIILENDLDSFFAEVTYDRDDNKIHFANKDGEEKATIDVSEFIKSDLIVEKAWYEDGKIHIKFTNGDEITVDVKELLDENEFKDGLQVVDGQVSVLIDGESDEYLSVGESGVKVVGVKADIEAEEARATAAEEELDAKIEAEIERAISAETALDEKIDQEIADREADVDEEETRAKAAETELKNTIGGGFSTASTETVTAKFNNLSSRLDVEVDNRTTQDNQLQNNINTESTARQAADTRLENLITDERNRAKDAEEALDAKIDQEIADREADVDAEEARATSAETALNTKIEAETARATAAEEALDSKIDQEIADRIADVNEEEARAKAAEDALDAKIEAETSARETADAELLSAIEEEEARAKGVEDSLDAKIDEAVSALTDNITAEVNNREALSVNSANYVKADNKIYFKNVNNETISEIDTTDFVVDGMIQDVKIENGNLVIDFNIDSGIEDIEIPLTEIFNPDNYYNKDAIDAKVTALENADAAEAEARSAADTTLQGSITAEATARADKDTELEGKISDEETRAKDVEDTISGNVDTEIARATAAEGELDTKIGDEEAARIAADEAQDVVIAEKADSSAVTADIAAATADMATQTWVGEQGYLTEHQSLSAYSTTEEMNDAIASATANLATKNEVQAVDDKVEAIDLTPYAKIADVNDELALKADKTEIPTDFYTQEQVNVLMSQLLTRIELLEAKESIVVADTAEDVAAAPAGSDVVLASTEAIQALTSNTEYNTLTIVGGSANNGDIKAKVADKLTVDGMAVNGDKGASNGRILVSASTVDLKNVTIESGSTAYNVFEGTQNTAASEYFTSTYNVSNLTADNTELNHNIINIYTLADNAVINIKDCNLNLDVDNSNLLRMANYTNATGITINFENIDWTYENAPASDWRWAGLMIFQPSATDVALNGDMSKIGTWTINVKDCRYNGVKVTENGFGEHNQVVYLYNINKTGGVTDASTVMTINFE